MSLLLYLLRRWNDSIDDYVRRIRRKAKGSRKKVWLFLMIDGIVSWLLVFWFFYSVLGVRV